MTRPKDRAALLYAAEEEFDRLRQSVAEVPVDLRDAAGACEDWSVKDLLAHLDAWHEMFLRWEAVGSAGEKPSMPAVGFNWRQVPELNHQIFEQHKHDEWATVEERVERSYNKVIEVISSYSDEDLFTKGKFSWTGSTSIGSYATSATSSHYVWARKLITGFTNQAATPGPAL